MKNYFRFDRNVNDELTSDGSSRRTKLKDNIVAVEITASPYATEILTESPVYTWVELISNIGGQTSELIHKEPHSSNIVFPKVYGSVSV